MSALEFYIVTVAIFGCLNGILALGFNMQFGQAGIVNLAFIVLVAVGAYATAIASVQPASGVFGGTGTYIGGFGWVFPWNMLFGVAATLLFGLLLGGAALLRLRHDYFALCLFAIGVGLQVLVTDYLPLLNGSDGIGGMSAPGQNVLDPSIFQFVFLGISVVALAFVYFIFARVSSSPLGRAMKAVRDDEEAAAAVAKNPWRLKLIAFLLGSLAAGIGGSLQALYVGGWSVQGWGPLENLVLLAAVIVGGRGRNLGALVGSFIVLEGILEATRFLPAIGDPGLLPNLQTIAIGLLILGFLWWRPQGILPEKKERFALPASIGLATASLTRPVPAQAGESERTGKKL
ncbi:MAG TPA: branched-chain amino acid ABC transporter permease [Candidatus Acidoferrum sp.]|jgi:branched-chain amino acid transport system permease protein|nr:branched-chain amino acid ABC transporter permease [Candidatus Acidoferrum sp.]